jgi:hypothetical protein
MPSPAPESCIRAHALPIPRGGAFADRPRDQADNLSIAHGRGRALDWDAVEARLSPLVDAKADPIILDRFQALRKQFGV